MPRGLIRYHHTGNFRFITVSCFQPLKTRNRSPFGRIASSGGLLERHLWTRGFPLPITHQKPQFASVHQPTHWNDNAITFG